MNVNYEWFFPIACLAIVLLLLGSGRKKEEKLDFPPQFKKRKQRSRFVKVASWLYYYYKKDEINFPDREDVFNFYQTERWATLSWEIKDKYGRVCMKCGRSRRKHGVILNTDHIYSVGKFWRWRFMWWNLQVLCQECNKAKRSGEVTDFRGLCLGRLLLKFFSRKVVAQKIRKKSYI